MRLADLIHKYQLLGIDPTYFLLEGSPRFKWFNSVRPKPALTFRFGGLAIQVPDSLPLIFGGGL